MPRLQPGTKINSNPAPGLVGIVGLPAGAETKWTPAHPNNYRVGSQWGTQRRFLAICYHTPEEPILPGSVFNTPAFFQQSTWGASTGYSIAHDGSVYQSVLDEDVAFGQGVDQSIYGGNSPLPSWWKPAYGKNANSWCLSVEIEGCSDVTRGAACKGQAPIWETMDVDGDQFQGVVAWTVQMWRQHPELPRARDRLLSHGFLDPKRRSDPSTGFPFDILFRRALDLYTETVSPSTVPARFSLGLGLGKGQLRYAEIAYDEAANVASGTGDNRYQAPTVTTIPVAAYTGPGTVHDAILDQKRKVRTQFARAISSQEPPDLSESLGLEDAATYAGQVPPRRARVALESADGAFTPLTVDGEELRIKFDISYDSERGRPWVIELWNLSPENVERVNEFTIGGRFSLAAGYGAEYGLVCGGEVQKIDQVWQPPDRITRFQCGNDEIGLESIVFSAAWRSDSTILQAIEEVARIAGFGIGSTKLVPGLGDPVAPMVSFTGDAKRALDELTRRGRAEWVNFCGQIIFWPRIEEQVDATLERTFQQGVGSSRLTQREYEAAVYEERIRLAQARAELRSTIDPSAVITEASGMIGQPTLSESGVKMKVRLNSTLGPGRVIRVESRVATGYYRITKLRHIGDSWQDEFATHIEAAVL